MELTLLRPGSSLFRFEWWIDQEGYELLPSPRPRSGARLVGVSGISAIHAAGQTAISPRGGPPRAYRIEPGSGLHREFASLKPDDESFLSFANRYGVLGIGILSAPVTTLKAESVDEWRSEHSEIKEVVDTMTSSSGGERHIAETFNSRLSPLFWLKIDAPRAKKPTMHLVPVTLLGAMWAEIAGELSYGLQYRKCKVCPKWFPFGAGTGAKKTKQFCSNRCRKTWHRHPQEDCQ